MFRRRRRSRERLLFPVEPRTPYPSPDGVLPDVYRTVIDPLSALTFVAGQTSRIALGTSVLNVPWYNATLLARSLTAVDPRRRPRESGPGILSDAARPHDSTARPGIDVDRASGLRHR